MEETQFKRILSSSCPFTFFDIAWDRGNGTIERKVFFEGFDIIGKPRLKLKDSRAYFNPNWIGGYNPIISLKEDPYLDRKDIPDGQC
jgi:hypothetical protein